MWRLLSILGRVCRILFWLALILVLAGILVLYLIGHDIPAPLVQRLAQAVSTDDVHVRIGRATFTLDKGLRLLHVKALPKRIADGPLLAVEEVAVALSLLPQTPMQARIRGVTLKNLTFPDLPPPMSDPPHSLPELPDLAPFPLRIEQADVLGLRVRSLVANVDVDTNRVAVSEALIHWPDNVFGMTVTGQATLDLTRRHVSGLVAGKAFPDNLMPLFEMLHARGAIRQINCFSKIARPVEAVYAFDVDIDSTDFAMRLGLDVGPCAYRGVPVSYAKGTLFLYGTNIHTTVVIDPLEAQTADGAPITGSLAYREETEGLEIDARTVMHLPPFTTIINVLNRGELDRIRCDTPPSLSVRGAIALSSQESTITNDLRGRVALDKGTILNFGVRDLTADFDMQGYSARFHQAAARSASGGQVNGEVTFTFPEYAATATVFSADIRFTGVELAEISQAFNVTNERVGLVNGNLHLTGPAYGDTVAGLNGSGHANIRNGVIHRMRLFAGLTDYLTRNIPGISSLVTQSSSSMDFTLCNGVFATENLLLEGDLVSIRGRGTYDLNTDKLDFTVRVSIFRQKTIAGRIVRLMTLPFSRLLLEFRVFGTLEQPEWTYVNLIERITEGFSDAPGTVSQPKP
ncbi:MAG TPA: AsmA-like C-terminal region-containing protein [Kiritimatiellia bacterium]|nr:AsmA-like C-terminal region-containing protein [Kiritimatiellia bacterium]HPW74987.1 AsmA-like C-terminal region-containing protein [Kiritimatiellia bacterium]